MITLKKFYNLLSRNTTVTLVNFVTGNTIYAGALKSLPDKYDNRTVYDFNVNDDGDATFVVA